MQDENKAPTESDEVTSVEPVEVLASELPVASPLLEVKPNTPYHVRSEQLAAQVRDLAAFGLSKTSVSITARISLYILEKYYMNDFLDGQSRMQRKLAAKAMEEAMDGNTPVLIHLLKTKLGWNETQLIEHSHEVRSVVSAKPLSKEEFIQKFLQNDDTTGEE
jgi:hypothetical protein